jgi:hypothetical protein
MPLEEHSARPQVRRAAPGMRRMRRWGILPGLAAFGLDVAAAQTTHPARELFNRGVADLLSGRPELACPALEESYRQDPLPGTLFVAAECHAVWGKADGALRRYEQYIRQVPHLSPRQQERHTDRVKKAREAIAKLSRDVPRLEPTPTDSASVGVGEQRSIEPPVPPEPATEAAPTPPLVLPPTRASERAQASNAGRQRSAELAASNTNSWRPWGWVLGGVGTVGIVAGTWAGVSALHQKSIYDDECDATCSERGLRARELGLIRRAQADVGLAVGLASLAAGAFVLLTTNDSEPRPGPTPSRVVGSVSASGVWLGVNQQW